MRVSRILSVLAVALAVLSLGLSLGAAKAHGGQFERHAFRNVSDIIVPQVEVQRISVDSSDGETEEAPEEDEAPALDDEGLFYVDYEPTYAAYYPTDGLTREGGVNYHEGRRETWYSSQVLYHKDTADWELDDEGYYRTEEGYYVVAASDMEQGTVFETSKGEAIVMDTGCPAGTTDFYTRF